MSKLFAPLRRPSVWIAFVIVLVLGATAVFVKAGSGAPPTKLTSGALLAFGVAFYVAAAVAFLGNREPDYRPAALEGVDRPRRRQMQKAVRHGDLLVLAEGDRTTGRDFARAYVASTPRVISPVIALLVGFLFQAAAQVADFDGDWLGYVVVVEAVLILGLLITLIPLHVKWLRNAERLSVQTVSQ
ncbi:hypothetical protein [Frondihabitans sp. PhB188]|uniref:hypothetical protein n=1 Tax=Frondihabitans sp. PhB188 TaxID=2485200 RepID=UPI0011CE5E32|nr:hypothetical protein [Frondihabitans sp. PhB188]